MAAIQKKIKIFLADDHTILREGLKVILESNQDYQIVGESGDGKDALEEVERLKPDVLILDISMPFMTGIEVARQVKRYNPQIKVIILSRHDNKVYIEKLLDIGINGYVLKDNAADDLTKAIEVSFLDKVYLSPEIKGHLGAELGEQIIEKNNANASIFQKLTNREQQILKLLAEGHSNKEIGNMFFISPSTVKTHRINIMRKLDFHRLADLIKYAVQNGLIET